tara:strand:+ start:201 stop:407 length:207 start_codon:yes stop_codon:yes gene_type:complete
LIEDQVILVECIGPVMHVTLSRPEVLNALNSDAHFFLEEASIVLLETVSSRLQQLQDRVTGHSVQEQI